ncbi:hypothetical protein KSC_109120 [Ktedonobacter sp. SOSP1-52]|nr:hypothetical protein KSC_109120 [Ktedonobacter sp. SOSP1-52]
MSPKLASLTLNHNCLISLPPEIGGLTNLRQLHIGNAGVSFMPEHVRNQADWQKYTENHNQLSELPQGVWNLKHLESLDL